MNRQPVKLITSKNREQIETAAKAYFLVDSLQSISFARDAKGQAIAQVDGTTHLIWWVDGSYELEDVTPAPKPEIIVDEERFYLMLGWQLHSPIQMLMELDEVKAKIVRGLGEDNVDAIYWYAEEVAERRATTNFVMKLWSYINSLIEQGTRYDEVVDKVIVELDREIEQWATRGPSINSTNVISTVLERAQLGGTAKFCSAVKNDLKWMRKELVKSA